MNCVVSKLFRSLFVCFLIILFLGLLPESHLAQTSLWSFVTNDREGTISWYLDTKTIVESKNKVQFRDKQVFSDGLYIKESMVIYCKTRKLQRVQAGVYSNNDFFVKNIKGKPIIDTVPESVSEVFYKILCTKERSVVSEMV